MRQLGGGGQTFIRSNPNAAATGANVKLKSGAFGARCRGSEALPDASSGACLVVIAECEPAPLCTYYTAALRITPRLPSPHPRLSPGRSKPRLVGPQKTMTDENAPGSVPYASTDVKCSLHGLAESFTGGPYNVLMGTVLSDIMLGRAPALSEFEVKSRTLHFMRLKTFFLRFVRLRAARKAKEAKKAKDITDELDAILVRLGPTRWPLACVFESCVH